MFFRRRDTCSVLFSKLLRGTHSKNDMPVCFWFFSRQSKSKNERFLDPFPLVVCLSPSVCQWFVSGWAWLTCTLTIRQSLLTCCSTHLRSSHTDHQLPVLSRYFPKSLRQLVVKPSVVAPKNILCTFFFSACLKPFSPFCAADQPHANFSNFSWSQKKRVCCQLCDGVFSRRFKILNNWFSLGRSSSETLNFIFQSRQKKRSEKYNVCLWDVE